MDIMDKIMKKLNKKEQAIIVELFNDLRDIKDENDELIDMFVTEKCFSNIKDKVIKKYKNKNNGESGIPVEEASCAMPLL